MNPLITWLGGTRFVLSLGCGIACTLLRAFDRLDNATFGLVVLGTVGAYIAGSTYQQTRTNAKES